MKKFLKVFLIIIVVMSAVYLAFRYVPISKNPEDSILTRNRAEDGYEYNGVIYSGIVGTGYHDCFENNDEIYWSRVELKNKDNIKEVYPKYTTLSDKVLKQRFYVVDDKLLIYDTGSNFLERYFVFKAKDKTLTMPEFSEENIDSITQCVGVYDFKYNEFPKDSESYIMESKPLEDNEIKTFIHELKNSPNANDLISEAKSKYADWDSYQSEFERHCLENIIDFTEEDKAEIFYEVKFKGDDFPFNIIIREEWEETEDPESTVEEIIIE